jgi:hypothetical protein
METAGARELKIGYLTGCSRSRKPGKSAAKAKLRIPMKLTMMTVVQITEARRRTPEQTKATGMMVPPFIRGITIVYSACLS